MNLTHPRLSTPEVGLSQSEVKSSKSSQSVVNLVSTEFDELVNSMIEHCLKPNPTARKLKKVKDSLLQVRPEVADMNGQFVGRAWREAKDRFKSLTSSDKALDDQHSPLDKPLEVTEVIPEGLTGALSVTSKPLQGLTPPGSPVQVNINVTTDQQKETKKSLPPPSIGGHVTNKALAEEARRLSVGKAD
jgi:hypothetical protein